MNKGILFFQLIITFSLHVVGQSPKYFEGKITYLFSFKTGKAPDPGKSLSRFFGYGSTMYFKEGNYKHEFEGGLIEFDLYKKDDNKTYLKKRNNDTIYWADCSINGDGIQNLSYSPKTDTVLGIICDRLLIKYKDRSDVHYYNSDFIKINPAWFEKFKLNGEYLIDRKEKSIYLKAEHPFDSFTLTETAIKISAEPVNNEKFKLPANVILAREE